MLLYVRKGFTLSLLVVLLFGAGYFYYVAQAVCPTPLSYSLGEIDPRFNLTKDEALLAISKAESVWEDATGRNLFTQTDNGKIVINFTYDQRQKFVTAEGSFKEQLEWAESQLNSAVKATSLKAKKSGEAA